MTSKLEFLYLNHEDMLAAGVADMDRCMNAMEDMFVLLDRGDYRMGGENANEHGIRVSFPKETDIEGMPTHEPDKRFMAMPAYLGGRFRMFGMKSYGSNPRNPEIGLPRSILMVSLLDAQTGAPLAYMSANVLSAMRTGAASGVGAKHLARQDAATVAVIGPGTMSRYTMKAFMVARPGIRTVRIKGRGRERIDSFIAFCKENFPQIREYVICDSLEEVCQDADIVFYGTTNAKNFEDNPRVERSWLKKGALVISASALLVDTAFLASPEVKLVADNYKMYEGWGEGQPLPTQKNVSTLLGMGFYDAICERRITRDMIADMGAVIRGKQTGRDSEEQIILCAVGGLPIEDVAWAHDCYQCAKEKGIGTTLTVWDEPEL